MKTKAAVIYEMELPRPYADSQPLKVEDIELEAPGGGEVLVELTSAGLCHSDLSVMNGSRPRVMPMVLGHEAAGIVRETGPGVTDLKQDDPVVFAFVPMCGRCLSCAGGRPVMCLPGQEANAAGTLLSGASRFRNARSEMLYHHTGVSGFSQYTVAAEQSLIKVDSSLPMDKAALFGCAIMTGTGAVFNRARVAPGTSVVVVGLGGVGLSAVMGARAAGAYPIVAVDLLENKRTFALECGATHTVDAGADDHIQQIMDITHGGAISSIEAAGSEKAQALAYQATARGGTMVTVGLAHPSKQLSISSVNIVAEEKSILGCYMGSCVPKRDLPRFIEMYRAGILPVDKLFSDHIPLEDINRAFDDLDQGKVIRQIVKFS